MNGFFAEAPTAPPPDTGFIPKCGACGLSEGCSSPKMPVTGDGRRGILIVAEAPGEEEDKQGIQLIGKAGQELRSVLLDCNIDLDRDCWKTNAIICRPPDNRSPSNDEVDYCRPNINRAIRDLKPKVIVPLGNSAVRSIIGPLWREDPGGITTWAGWRIPGRRHNAWICPTYHPSYILRSEKKPNYDAIRIWWKRHLAALEKLESRPYKEIPIDYRDLVRLVYDSDEASDILKGWMEKGGRISFDYETNRLQPYFDDSEIVSCAVCWEGKETIAFPWVGSVVKTMRKLLQSDLPKIGANIKFEDQWTHEILGCWVRNWVKDVMQDAHILDNRKGITSVKFQAFVRLGVEDWSAQVKPYLESSGSDGKNRIRELDDRILLTYNGIDSIVEFDIAEHQWGEWKNA